MERLFAFLILFSIPALAQVDDIGSLISQGYAEQAATYRKLKGQLQQIETLENLSQNSSADSELKIELEPKSKSRLQSITYPEMKSKIKKDTMVASKR